MRTSETEQSVAKDRLASSLLSVLFNTFRLNIPFKLLLVGLLIHLLPALVILPKPAQAQFSPHNLNMRTGIGSANQIYKLYGSDDLKASSHPVIGPIFSLGYNSILTNMFSFNTGLSYKVKGTSFNKNSRTLAAKAILPYQRDVLSTSGRLMFFPFSHSVRDLFFGGGIGFDYLLGEKPKIHERFPYDVEVYFDQDDFRRLTMFASFCVGFMLFIDGLFLEFEYAPNITRNLNVRQLQINDTYWSISLVVYGRPE